MKWVDAAEAKRFGITYADEYGRIRTLTQSELDFFTATLAKVLAATGIRVPVETRDHEQVTGHENALGIYYKNDAGDEFITIDNYFIHERYAVECCGYRWALEPETLAGVICHELAHVRYRNHTKYHAALTERYADMVEKCS